MFLPTVKNKFKIQSSWKTYEGRYKLYLSEKRSKLKKKYKELTAIVTLRFKKNREGVNGKEHSVAATFYLVSLRKRLMKNLKAFQGQFYTDSFCFFGW